MLRCQVYEGAQVVQQGTHKLKKSTLMFCLHCFVSGLLQRCCLLLHLQIWEQQFDLLSRTNPSVTGLLLQTERVKPYFLHSETSDCEQSVFSSEQLVTTVTELPCWSAPFYREKDRKTQKDTENIKHVFSFYKSPSEGSSSPSHTDTHASPLFVCAAVTESMCVLPASVCAHV